MNRGAARHHDREVGGSGLCPPDLGSTAKPSAASGLLGGIIPPRLTQVRVHLGVGQPVVPLSRGISSTQIVDLAKLDVVCKRPALEHVERCRHVRCEQHYRDAAPCAGHADIE